MLAKYFEKINWSILLIVATAAIVFYANYVPGTFLSGWDNFHPEFNLVAALERNFWWTWQPNQGLGIVAGLAHGADLFRTLIIGVIASLLPTSMIRWLFTFSMYTLGGVGAYLLGQKLFSREVKGISKQELLRFIDLNGLLAALFYLFNFGAVQIFYISTETYTSFFGWLPIWLYLSISYLEKPKLRIVLALIASSLLGASAFITPTLLIPFGGILVVLSINFLISKPKFNSVIKIVSLAVIILVSHAHWLIPSLVTTPIKVPEIAASKITQNTTEDIIARNDYRSNITDLVQFKSSLHDTSERDVNGEATFILATWIDFLDVLPIQLIQIGLNLVAVIGALGVFSKKFRYISTFVVTASLSSLVILFPEQVSSVPVIGEAFRFAFLKLIIPLVLSLAILFSASISRITLLLVTGLETNFTTAGKYFVLLMISIPILVVSFPIFTGELIYPQIKVNIPQEYFETFEFFDKQEPDARLATFPAYSYFGWHYYDWGYTGSGFIWYGVKQPVLDRTFDHWSKENESFYLEYYDAIYSEDLQTFENVLKKYNVQYIWADYNEITFDGSQSELRFDILEAFVGQSDNLSLANTAGDIWIYEYIDPETNDNYQTVYPSANWQMFDPVYTELGDYVANSISFEYFFPFTAFSTRSNIQITSIEGEKYLLSETVPQGSYRLAKLPGDQLYLYDGNRLNIYQGQDLIVEAGDNIQFALRLQNNHKLNRSSQELAAASKHKLCSRVSRQEDDFQVETDSGLTYTNYANITCDNFGFDLGDLSTDYVLVEVLGENIQGRETSIYFENAQSQQILAETSTQFRDSQKNYFLVNTHDVRSLEVHINNINYGGPKSINKLQSISVYPFDLKSVSSMHLVRTDKVFDSKEIMSFNTAASIIKPGLFIWDMDDYQSVEAKFYRINGWEIGLEANILQKDTLLFLPFPQVLNIAGLAMGGLLVYYLFLWQAFRIIKNKK